MKIKELYYRFKYRPKKGRDGPVGIVFSQNKKKSDFEKQMDDIAGIISPGCKSNRDVLAYIQSKYSLQSAALSERRLTSYKINYILNHCPEVLQTPEPKFSENGKAPGRNEFLAFHESQQKRFAEAEEYPLERLGLDLEAYFFEFEVSDGRLVVFEIICENRNDDIFITAEAKHCLASEEDARIRKILDEITVYKGVKKEDIDNRTAKFKAYSAAFLGLAKCR